VLLALISNDANFKLKSPLKRITKEERPRTYIHMVKIKLNIEPQG
jgi:hypothetical protein